MLSALDLFCGYGGWSDGFAAEGFEVLGIDIEPGIAKWYPYPLITTDVRTLDGDRLTGQFDVILASPPCQEFSSARRPRLANPDMSCVNATKDIIARAKPRFWVMENVRGAIAHIGAPTIRFFPWYFWGHFPGFLKYCERAPRKNIGSGKSRRWRDSRTVAMIPLQISTAIAHACRVNLE
jgi:site-specific DNA-cytosine methylase